MAVLNFERFLGCGSFSLKGRRQSDGCSGKYQPRAEEEREMGSSELADPMFGSGIPTKCWFCSGIFGRFVGLSEFGVALRKSMLAAEGCCVSE